MKILGENANLFNVTVVKFTSDAFTQRELVVAYISYLYLATRCIYVFARLHAYFIVLTEYTNTYSRPLCIISIRLITNVLSGELCSFALFYLALVVSLLPRFRVSFFFHLIRTQTMPEYRERIHEFGRLVRSSSLERSGPRKQLMSLRQIDREK